MNESNNQWLTKSAQYLQTKEASDGMARFGQQYGQFLMKYPMLKDRTTLIIDTKESVKQGGMSLVQIDNYFQPGASEYWLKLMIVELMSFLGAIEQVQSFQVKGLATRIRQEYYHLTPAELTHFFYSFSMGDYGKLYAGKTVNPQDILIGLKEYMNHLYEKRVEVVTEERIAKEKAKMAEEKAKAVSWEEYCKSIGREPTANPLGNLLNKYNEESKRK